MKEILFICDTPRQIISAIQIRMNILKQDDVDIIITDDMRGASNLVNKIKNLKLFRNVYHVKGTKLTFTGKSSIECFSEIFKFEFGKSLKSIYYKYLEEVSFGWDVIYFYNITMFLYYIYDRSLTKKTSTSLIRYDEGLFCYPVISLNRISRRYKFIEFIRRIKRKKSLINSNISYEVFYPELLSTVTNGECTANKIPFITRDEKTRKLLNEVFSFNANEFDYVFSSKYIYFPAAFNQDGINISEIEIVNKIAKVLGKDNIIIKTHPRDKSDIYKEYGYQVYRRSDVPWEIIQLNFDFSKNVFITLTSTAPIEASLLFADSIVTYYLFPYIISENKRFKWICNKDKKILEALQHSGYYEQIRIIDDINKILIL